MNFAGPLAIRNARIQSEPLHLGDTRLRAPGVIWTYAELTAPAKFVHDVDGRRGQAISSLVSGGCIVSGASLRRSLVFSHVRVNSYAQVEKAVILPEVDIGRGARLTNVVVDHGVRIPEGLVIGEDPELDAARFRRTDSGICLVTQPMIDRLLS